MELLKKYQKNTLTEEEENFLKELSELIFINYTEINKNSILFSIISSIITSEKIYFNYFEKNFNGSNVDEIFALLKGVFSNEETKHLIPIYALFVSVLFNTSDEFISYMDDKFFKENEKQIFFTQICKNNTKNNHHLYIVYSKIKKFIEKYAFNLNLIGENVQKSLNDLNCFTASLLLPKISKTAINNLFELDMKKREFNGLFQGYFSNNLSKNYKKQKDDYEEETKLLGEKFKSKVLSCKNKVYGKTVELMRSINFEENLILNFIKEDEEFQIYLRFSDLSNQNHIFLNSEDLKQYKEIKDYRKGKRLVLSFERRISDTYYDHSLSAIRRWIFNYNNEHIIGSIIFHDDCFLCIDSVKEVSGSYELNCLYPDINNHCFKMCKFSISDLDDLELLDKSNALVFYNELLHVDSMSMLFSKTNSR